jgi:hypothetical protein
VLGIGSSLGLLLVLGGVSHSSAQVTDGDTAAVQHIYVDDHCQVLSPDTGAMRSDSDLCRLDGMGVHRSSHVAAKEVDGVRQHSLVNVAEQTYLLQNIYGKPVVFVVAQQVPDGWHVDSDPQPSQVKSGVAIFRVNADPGQIVRLHVGVERETPIVENQ